MPTSQLAVVTSAEELRALAGEPTERVRNKVRSSLDELHR
jgi:hypothetical protein